MLAESFEQTLFKTPVASIHDQHDSLRAQGHRLITIRSALEGVAATLRLEMRRAFEHDMPPPDAGASPEELKSRTIIAISNIRPALQNAIMFLARSLGMKLDGFVAPSQPPKPADSDVDESKIMSDREAGDDFDDSDDDIED